MAGRGRYGRQRDGLEGPVDMDDLRPLHTANMSHSTNPADETAQPVAGAAHTIADAASTVADAAQGNWVDTFAPARTRPYLRLIRADRPIGTWLLLFPCLWSMALAQIAAGDAVPNLWFAVLFALGAFVMRGAGCAFNDYVDRDFDAQVARTRSRPIPSGQIKPWQALVVVAVLGFVGLGVLLQFNGTTIVLAIASLALVVVYPFMKRFTHWPQVILGLTFNWGALVGWTAIAGEVSAAAMLLYAGAVAWTIGYDTIYAHQDKEDDLMLGLKSTAIRFGAQTKLWLAVFYAATVMSWTAACWLAGAGVATILGLAALAVCLAWQVVTVDIDDPANCLVRFKANREVGALFLIGLLIDLIA
ncbi:MAG: 4-hydroxybenzoate octaprenyltransferase [Pseudomonadota bacterium]